MSIIPNLDLTGQQFGRLTVTGISRTGPLQCIYWQVRCSCGMLCEYSTQRLVSGRCKSCGCAVSISKTRHGMKNSPTWRSWRSMKTRCLNPKYDNYDRYGGRGIKVCDRWLTFDNFLSDMGVKPTPDHTVDRINTDGNYEPGNCRWATDSEQGRNKSSNAMHTIDGHTRCLAEWCEVYDIPRSRVEVRLKCGWDILLALTKPSRRKNSSPSVP